MAPDHEMRELAHKAANGVTGAALNTLRLQLRALDDSRCDWLASELTPESRKQYDKTGSSTLLAQIIAEAYIKTGDPETAEAIKIILIDPYLDQLIEEKAPEWEPAPKPEPEPEPGLQITVHQIGDQLQLGIENTIPLLPENWKFDPRTNPYAPIEILRRAGHHEYADQLKPKMPEIWAQIKPAPPPKLINPETEDAPKIPPLYQPQNGPALATSAPTLIVGPAGSGKTDITIAAIDTPTLYIACEDAPEIHRRLEGKSGVRILSGWPDRKQRDQLLPDISNFYPETVVIDPISDACVIEGIDENDRAAPTILLHAIREMVPPNARIVFIHHMRKHQAQDSSTALDKIRGTSAWAATPALIWATQAADGIITVKNLKRRDGPQLPSWTFNQLTRKWTQNNTKTLEETVLAVLATAGEPLYQNQIKKQHPPEQAKKITQKFLKKLVTENPEKIHTHTTGNSPKYCGQAPNQCPK